MPLTLIERLLTALGEEHRAATSARADLAEVLGHAAAEASGHGAVDNALLAAVLARAIEAGEDPAGLEHGDLYLAAWCATGDSAALRRFDGLYGAELDRAIGRSPTLGLSADEFRQLVYDRLFVRDGERAPRISQYVGKGSLKAWVRVMTSRFIIDLSRRRDRSTAPDDGLAEKIGAGDDTELDYLRHTYGPALDAAFEAAVAQLTVRQRNLLRQRYLHQVPADTLAKIYGVHRSTLFLWLDKARASLLDHVRVVLAQRVPGDQLESVVGVLGSRLQLSVRRMLDSRLESDTD
ncbi:MAG: hypothetical protein AAF721_13395 [Myxococcota bacterium]